MADERIQVIISGNAEQLRPVMEQAARSVAVLGSEIKRGEAEGRAAFRELGRAAGEFKSALSEMADRIAPHFKEVMALSLAGAAAEMHHLGVEAGETLRTLEAHARMLNVTTDDLEAFRLAGAMAGVSTQQMDRSLFMMSRRIGMIHEEFAKTTTSFMEFQQLQTQASLAMAGVTIWRGGAQAAIDWKKIVEAQVMSVTKSTTDATEAFIKINAFIQKIPDAYIRNAMALQYLGRSAFQASQAFTNLGPMFAAAKKAIEDSGAGASRYEFQIGAAFNRSRAIFDFFIERVKTIFGVEYDRALTLGYNALNNFFQQNMGAIRKWAVEFGNAAVSAVQNVLDAIRELHEGVQIPGTADWARALVSFFHDLPGNIRAAIDGINAFAHALDPLGKFIGNLTGYNISGWSVLVGAALLQLSGILKVVTTAVGILTAALRLMGLSNPAIALIYSLITAGVLLYENWSKLGAFFRSFWNLVVAAWEQPIAAAKLLVNSIFGAGAWNTAKQEIARFWSDIESAWATPIANLRAYVNSIVESAERGINALRRLLGLSSGGREFTAPIPPVGQQSGGPVGGRGSGDIIPAMLEPGEFVMRKAAVDQYGLGVMHQLNSMRFAMGGIVPGRMQFASGGSATSGMGRNPIHLHLGGSVYPMHASDSVASSLAREAKSDQMRSAGAKPSWYAGKVSA